MKRGFTLELVGGEYVHLGKLTREQAEMAFDEFRMKME